MEMLLRTSARILFYVFSLSIVFSVACMIFTYFLMVCYFTFHKTSISCLTVFVML